MSKLLLDGLMTEPTDAMSIEIEKIDVDRGYIKVPLGRGHLSELPISDTARIGDVIHIPVV